MTTTIDRITAAKIVAIVRLDSYERAVPVAEALLAGGITVLEFTLTGQGAMEAVRAVQQALGASVCVGLGSVLHEEDALRAIQSGAEFLVTPAFRPHVIAAAQRRDVPVACGAFTPTELLAAHEHGAAFVKLFPASVGGPRYVRDVLAPLPFLRLVPTGGVSAENAREFLNAGAVAVGIGGNLIPKAAVASGDYAQITAAARACVEAIT